MARVVHRRKGESTTREAAHELGCHINTVKRMLLRGELPASERGGLPYLKGKKRGGCWLIPRSEIDRNKRELPESFGASARAAS